MPTVAPFTGAWIEMSYVAVAAVYESVAPFTGAWIEMIWISCFGSSAFVAPFTGAWLEIFTPCGADFKT